MDRIDLGSVIAERQLLYSDPENGSRLVRVLLGAPRESPGGGEWYCPWQILGIGGEKVLAAYGIDAVQSLQLAMTMIGANLYAHADQGRRLSWGDRQPGDFGFPWGAGTPVH